jgi:transcription elongation factor Elf1
MKKAKVQIFMVDFECPYCKAIAASMSVYEQIPVTIDCENCNRISEAPTLVKGMKLSMVKFTPKGV